MRRNLVLITVIILMEQYNAQNHCKDIHQHVVSQGLHYIPGTNPCTLCVCDKGGPKWCKSVLCAPPQNCKSFQVGTLCCEFKCLDDILTVHDDTYDVALRFIASAVTAILSLSLLFFLFHRLKRRKVLVHQNQQLGDDQRSLNSIGYIAGSLGYLPESIGYLGSGNAHEIEFHYEEASTQYSLWKPPGNYFPRGEAPPPYEEAVRAAQLENNIINSQIRLANSLTTALNIPRQSPQTLQENTCSVSANSSCRHDCTVGTTAHTHTHTHTHSNCPMTGSTQQYTNVIVQDVTVHNTNEPPKFDTVKQRVNNNKGRSHSTIAHRSENTNHERAYENIPLSGKSNVKRDKAATSGYKNQKTEVVHEYTNVDNKPTIKISKYDVIVESRADKPSDVDGVCKAGGGAAPSSHTAHRQVPENVGDLAAEMKKTPSYELRKYKSGDRNARMVSRQGTSKEMPSHRTLPKNLRELLANAEQIINESSKIDDRETMRRSHASSYDVRLSTANGSSSKSQGRALAEGGTAVVGQDIAEIPFIPPAPPNFASPTICESNHNNEDEEQLSLISYQCLSSSQDEDDYRSECENCKSSGFTIPEDEETDILNETMTLQRRPLETGEEVPSYYRTSLTLPTNTRKSRAVVTNSNRESWFTSMQETSSSDDDV